MKKEPPGFVSAASATTSAGMPGAAAGFAGREHAVAPAARVKVSRTRVNRVLEASHVLPAA
jgi:hypothetical protein